MALDGAASRVPDARTDTRPDIRIDGDGDGDWVMGRVGGSFDPEADHALMRTAATPSGERRLGGMVLCQFLGSSLTCHMAGEHPAWLSKTLIWMMFHYAFVQLGCRKVIALVCSSNTRALAMDLRAGFRLEAVVRDAYADGHMMVLTMDRANCRWLRVRPQGWAPGPDGDPEIPTVRELDYA